MSLIRTSIHGRELGLDANRYLTTPKGAAYPEVKVGPTDSEVSVMGANSVTTPTTADTISAGGTSVMSATAAKSYSLAAPVPGIRKVLTSTVSATLARTITLASGTFVSTALSTGTSIVFNGLGQTVQLLGLSTSQYFVEGNTGATLA